MNEEAQELWTAFYASKHKDFFSFPALNGNLAMRNGWENKYSQAYQVLVKKGLAPQLKRKYR